MAQQPLGSYLRTYRKKAGLTQQQLATLLGYKSRASVSRHERSNALPPLQIVLAYEVIFRVPVTDLFPNVYYAIEDAIVKQLSDLESTLQQKSASERVLEWMRERRLGIDL